MNKKKFSLIAFIIGMIALVAGTVVLVLNFVLKPDMRDAEFLVEVGTWQKEDEPGVIWDFTEVGKGKLTTNDHKNDYDFIWAMDGNNLKIETKWLYTLNDEYTYELNQGDKKLVLTKDEEKITFLPYVELNAAGGVDAEVTENN